MGRILILSLILLASCGYRFDLEDEGRRTISVPYVQGDYEGKLTDAIIRALSQSGAFEYQRNRGRYSLEVTIVGDNNERIGFRRDRSPSSGKVRKNIIGTENRRSLAAEVTLIDTVTDVRLLGPITVSAWADYDYVNENALNDLSFIDGAGIRESSIQFSLGQLDSKDSAERDVLLPLYWRLAQKIIDGILAYDSND